MISLADEAARIVRLYREISLNSAYPSSLMSAALRISFSLSARRSSSFANSVFGSCSATAICSVHSSIVTSSFAISNNTTEMYCC